MPGVTCSGCSASQRQNY